MTVAHYKQAHISEEDFHRWVTKKHAVPAAKLHAKNGIEGFNIVSVLTVLVPYAFSAIHSHQSVFRPQKLSQYDIEAERHSRKPRTNIVGDS